MSGIQDSYHQTLLGQIAESPHPATHFLGSPSIVRSPDGQWLASHDIFSHQPDEWYANTLVYASRDGRSWQLVCRLQGLHWASLFCYQDVVYLLGTSEPHGSVVIRKSLDCGRTFTQALDGKSGLLLPVNHTPLPDQQGYRRYHCAPTPVVVHEGRIYRAFERKTAHTVFPSLFSFVLSAPVDADLLDCTSWTKSEENTVEDCLEGNVIIGPGGEVWNLLRRHRTNTACLYQLAEDCKGYRLVRQLEMPGGDVKFTVRYDPVSKLYLSLTSCHTDISRAANDQRNVLGLIYSADLLHWTLGKVVIQERNSSDWAESVRYYGFQYLDWAFDGEDIVAVSRTSYDGANSFHNSNRITAHRIQSFRSWLRPLNWVGHYPLTSNLLDYSGLDNHLHTPTPDRLRWNEEGLQLLGGQQLLAGYLLGNCMAGASSLRFGLRLRPQLDDVAGVYPLFTSWIGRDVGVQLELKTDGRQLLVQGLLRSMPEESGMVFTSQLPALCPQLTLTLSVLVDFAKERIVVALDGVPLFHQQSGCFLSKTYLRSAPAQQDSIATATLDSRSFVGTLAAVTIDRETETN